ncbi:RNA polymerase I associated factor, A49-like protein [Sparassis latifolia]|uniref:DNA-directed RNA polymerase I subunit rpa49 n=1 Tax=Sparassis crispa TaxID=139825 RepID=A0A401GY91_9APHY|nr:DNA-directed RNA polymerase I subunit rpa49 [Sparassis crispa]GBE87161.1 DNA-directed RNA polymerase I subunit rpa49 [Sparassis crispa]
MASSSSKKRKRGADDAHKASLKISSQPVSQLGPVLASFPALHPPESTAFQCWSRDEKKNSDEPFVNRRTFVGGEADAVEFSTSHDSELQQSAAGCSYLIGVHDKRTNTTTLRPAPLHILVRQVKALKNLAPMQISSEDRMHMRNQLGETFGTKRAKAAIRAQERNRVDVDAMRGVASHLQDTIQENTGSLPTREEAKASADSNRLIPPHDANAQRPDDVYAIHDIIPDNELNALSVSAFKAAETDLQRVALLPYSKSHWVNQHLRLLFSAPKLKKSEMKILLYISSMFAFKTAQRIVSDKEALQKRLSSVPGPVLDGLLSRFTESARNTSVVQVTTQSETMLLTYMFALCLRLDDYATDTTLIAHDLSMPVTNVNTLFKSLGCKVEKLGPTELKWLGLPDTAGQTKRAILKVPVEFPQARNKRTRR